MERLKAGRGRGRSRGGLGCWTVSLIRWVETDPSLLLARGSLMAASGNQKKVSWS